MPIQNNNPFEGPSFSLQNRLMRLLWGITWLLLFRFSPRPFHAWRAFILRIFGATIGQHVHIYPKVSIWAPWDLKISNHVGIANNVTIYNMAPITIGHHCVISQGSHLCAGSHDYNSSNFQLIAKPITLENYVWICADAFVSLGVTIPEGVVIGARAVVTKSPVEPWAVYAGNNPCRFIKKRQPNIKATM